MASSRRFFLRLSLWLLSLAAFLAVAEGICALVGVVPLVRTPAPIIDLVEPRLLFVRSDDGSMLETAPYKTHFFNLQRFPATKPAGTFRIFCLGGSTTYGRPYDDSVSYCAWLREWLPTVAPDRHWEVINAGGISYASYRLVSLCEELSGYEPDLFIVYTGHNEFLEDRAYGNLLYGSPAFRGAWARLGHSRLFRFLSQQVRPASAPLPTETPLREEVLTRLDRSLGPVDFKRDDALRRQICANYRHNLERMTAIALEAGARILYLAPASYLKAMKINPDHAAANNNLAVLLVELGRLERAEKHYRKAVAVRPNYANALENLAMLLDQTGRPEEAEQVRHHMQLP